MSSIIPCQNINSPFPIETEWRALVSFLATQVQSDIQVPESVINDFKDHCQTFYHLLANQQKSKSQPRFYKKSYPHFLKIVLFSEKAFFQCRQSFLVKQEINPKDQQAIDIIKQESLNRRVAFIDHVSPFRTTLHKITSVYLTQLAKLDVIIPSEKYGFVVNPLNKEQAIHYICDERGTIIPFEHYPTVNSPFHTRLVSNYSLDEKAGPLERMVVIGDDHRLCLEAGFVLRVRPDTLNELILYTGNHPETPFCRTPVSVGVRMDFKDHPLTNLLSHLIPSEKQIPGYTKFYPLPEKGIDTELVELALLEEFIEEQAQDKLVDQEMIQKVKEEIVERENTLIDHYKKELEQKIQKEQDERKQLVISGEIDKINKHKSSKKKISHQKADTSSSSSSSSLTAVQKLDSSAISSLLEQAKEKLQVEKKRIKKHRFMAFVTAVKKIFGKDQYNGMITQHGSHLTLHTEEKESLTLVVPHKKDRTSSGKLLNRFINKLQNLIQK